MNNDTTIFNVKDENAETKKSNLSKILQHIEKELHHMIDLKKDVHPTTGKPLTSWDLIYYSVRMMDEMNQLIAQAQQSKELLEQLGVTKADIEKAKAGTEPVTVTPGAPTDNVVQFRSSKKDELH